MSLAQKLSIRLHYSFTSGTVLYQLDAATLLSQFFGQSAVKIHNVFEALLSASEISPPALCILVIDEVESLAACRSRANAQGEVQDAVRATNALLTGLDKVMCRPNVLVICTSNLESSIDQAFLDRCSKRIEVGFPSAAGRYKILKHGLESLIERGIVVGDNLDLPDFDAAECRLPDDFNTVGCKLRRLAESFAESFIESKSDYLDSFAAPTEFKSEWLKGTQLLSPRWLSQLPELALAQQLEIGADTCTLEHCVAHIEAYFKAICPRSCPKRAPAPVCDAARSEKLRSLDISSVITEEEKRWRSCEEGAERKWKVIKKITSSPSKPSLTFSLDQRTLKLIVNAVVQEIDKRKTENMPDPVERLECSTTTMVTTDSGGSEWRPGSKRSLDDGDAPSHCNSPCSPGCSPSKRRRRLADSNLVPVDVAITKQAKVVKEAEEAIL